MYAYWLIFLIKMHAYWSIFMMSTWKLVEMSTYFLTHLHHLPITRRLMSTWKIMEMSTHPFRVSQCSPLGRDVS